MQGKSSTIYRLLRPTSQKRAYRAPKGAHRSAVLVFLGNKSLIRGSHRERAIPLTPYVRAYRNRARIEFTVMFEQKVFKLPGDNWYWFAGFSFLEWVAFCHDTSFRLEEYVIRRYLVFACYIFNVLFLSS